MATNKRWTGKYAATVIVAVCCLASTGSMAQQPSSGKLPDAPSATTQSQPAPQQANPLQSSMAFFSVLQRKSLVFPTLATSTGPLDPWEKFKLAASNSVSLSTIGGALIGSAYNQAVNTPAGYGRGGEGYAKRFGADMARSASSNIFGNFAIASVLHEDPRFYVKKHLSFTQAVKYSAVRVFVTRSDSGEHVTTTPDWLARFWPKLWPPPTIPMGTTGPATFLSVMRPTSAGSLVETCCASTGQTSTESCGCCCPFPSPRRKSHDEAPAHDSDHPAIIARC